MVWRSLFVGWFGAHLAGFEVVHWMAELVPVR